MRLPLRVAALLARVALLPLTVGFAPAQAQTPAQSAPKLTAQTRDDLRCSAAFAIVALEQSDGDALEGWPQLAVRGRTFFADSGERAMKEGALSREQVRDLIGREVQALQTAPDPDKALAALAKPCVARLDATVPPLVTPTLKQCAAILGLAYAEVHAREGMSASAQDLKTLESVLSSREREALIAAGSSGDDADRTLSEAREAMAVEAADGKGGVDKYDIAHCYELAKPQEKSHY
ncbi:hypothetical protein [Novosphingobium jiangmenense]|uniref:Uncharacterized protein n=1 Tax=Novosphingobium jiangmenense TaxID=2791981 RepID=A0ABS0HH76_9SPHN|nr:hypothetical protein [Novosphingobium jiangmenense]MBF9151314.1 hypothetical protein [Novosphingobium jiangmenense]